MRVSDRFLLHPADASRDTSHDTSHWAPRAVGAFPTPGEVLGGIGLALALHLAAAFAVAMALRLFGIA